MDAQPQRSGKPARRESTSKRPCNSGSVRALHFVTRTGFAEDNILPVPRFWAYIVVCTRFHVTMGLFSLAPTPRAHARRVGLLRRTASGAVAGSTAADPSSSSTGGSRDQDGRLAPRTYLATAQRRTSSGLSGTRSRIPNSNCRDGNTSAIQ